MWAETNIESEYFGSGKIVTKKYFCSESNYFLTYVRYLNYSILHFMNYDVTFEMLFPSIREQTPWVLPNSKYISYRIVIE